MEQRSDQPRGVPQPCAYEVVTQTELQAWTYDIDCREGMKQRADALFAQYKKTSAELVQAYNAAADAGIKPTDAGVAIRPPEEAVEVEVGAKALDHHGRGLLFIDDDAPCYVRVIGPDAPHRLVHLRIGELAPYAVAAPLRQKDAVGGCARPFAQRLDQVGVKGRQRLLRPNDQAAIGAAFERRRWR